MAKAKFPVLAVILLVFAIVWLLSELRILLIDIPWVPAVLILIAIGLIYNRFRHD